MNYTIFKHNVDKRRAELIEELGEDFDQKENEAVTEERERKRKEAEIAE